VLEPALESRPGDFALDGFTPQAVVTPRSAAEVSVALAEAHAAGRAVVPWGGGTHQGLGNRLSRYDLALCTAGLDRILEYHPADMIVTVEAGVTLAALQAHLGEAGQFVPLEAEDPARATIGGLVSTAISGPLRFSHGTVRDFTLWVEAVRPDGTLVHGGAKVVKNVAGYDTPKLFIGSLGSVGVVTAVTFKTAPLSPVASTVLFGFHDAEHAEELLTVLSAGRLQPSLVALVKGDAAWGTPFELAPWVVVAGADGPLATVEWQVERFLDHGRAGLASGAIALDGPPAWEARQALMTRRASGAVALKLNVLPSQVAQLTHLLSLVIDDSRMAVIAEAGNGVIRCLWDTAGDAWQEAARLTTELGGTWVLERCPAAWKADLDVWGPERPDRTLMRRLKAHLDPRSILNPGRFTGG
jgi:glycolate oxidase FAD binding subunit